MTPTQPQLVRPVLALYKVEFLGSTLIYHNVKPRPSRTASIRDNIKDNFRDILKDNFEDNVWLKWVREAFKKNNYETLDICPK